MFSGEPMPALVPYFCAQNNIIKERKEKNMSAHKEKTEYHEPDPRLMHIKIDYPGLLAYARSLGLAVADLTDEEKTGLSKIRRWKKYIR